MEITISIPDKFASAVENRAEISRQVLEAFAIESYRQAKMSLGEIAELLCLSIDEANFFLKQHKVPLNYDFADLEEDRRTLEMFLKK